MDFQDVTDFCRTRCWDYLPQKSVRNLEEMDAVPASVPDRMCVLQLQLLCMSSWARAYFTLAKVGISSSPAGISGQAEGTGGKTQTCCGQDEPWLRDQLKLLVHL